MKNFVLFLLFFVSGTLLNASSVSIFNDSPYPLHVQVLAADGTSKGKLQVNPQQQATWTDTSGYRTTWSQTPYTVIFTCTTGKIYGVFSGVSPGALVTAASSNGPHYCEPEKKEDEKETKTPPLSPEHYH